MSKEKFTNRLANEKSPYLLQHAHNPVNWYPWSDEAFTKAQKENKPIFLSIGYSTCHWCHVMARESFEDHDIANYLNEHFISIKVDREERPDVDSVYMKVCQMMTGQGGWPLTIFMTPDQIPFYAGTYFPKNSKYGIPSFSDLIDQLHQRYTIDPKHISQITDKVSHALKKTIQIKSEQQLTNKHVHEAFEQLTNQFDSTYGGFGQAPKFPQPQHILFLLKYNYFNESETALAMAEKSLQAMGNGGIYDHVGFGFSRYSTDSQWLVPHFEKMLYDNALLLIAYVEGYELTKDPFYKQISEQIIEFLNREMLASSGAFYSAIDADSEGVEGKYYTWDYDEILNTLDSELGELYTAVYNITPKGNFEGKNIPNRLDTPPASIEIENPNNERELMLEEARKKLLATRNKRIYPHVDDKILTSWNAMTVIALTLAGRVFNDYTYTKMAERALNFIENQLFIDSRLMARHRDGETKYKAYLDDYAYLIWAYLELYNTNFDLSYLHKAKQTTDEMLNLFWDSEQGGFYLSGNDAEKLITQDKEVYDGALPSGNSVAAVMLTKMASLTGNTTYLDYVETMYSTFYEDINRQASAASFFIQSLLLTSNSTKEVVIIGGNDDLDYKQFIDKLKQSFIPDTTILVGETPDDFKEIAPFAASYKQIDNKPTVYVCENFACQAPTTDFDRALQVILNK